MKKMNISFDSEAIIEGVKEDIDLFGEDFEVYALRKPSDPHRHILDYVDAKAPTKEECESESEYQTNLKEYHKDLEASKGYDVELMTLAVLLQKVISQDSILP